MNKLIVMLDIDERVVRLFGKYNLEIPFGYSFVLPSILNNEEIIYISSYSKSSDEEVIENLKSVIENSDFSKEKLYLNCTSNSFVRIPELKIVFSGPKDIKDISKIGWNSFDKSKTLKKLFVDGKLKILKESETKKIRTIPTSEKTNIIIDKSVEDFNPSSMFDDENNEVKDAEEVETENQNIMKKLGL